MWPAANTLILLFTIITCACGRLIYVSLQGSSDPTCGSIESTCAKISVAASVSKSGDEIVVYPGLYNDSAVFYHSLTIRGLSVAFPAIVQAEIQADHLFHAVFPSNGTGSLTISDMTLRRSTSSTSLTTGLKVDLGHKVKLTNVKFLDFYSTSPGGAVRFDNTREIVVAGCHFENNKVENYGGGISVVSTGLPLHPLEHLNVSGSVFVNNTAFYGGGLAVHYEGNNPALCTKCGLHVINNEFIHNQANFTGGAVDVFSDREMPVDMVNIEDNLFLSNAAATNGGGVRILHAEGDGLQVSVKRCNFTLNSAGIDGGGLYYPGRDYDTLTVKASSFSQNRCSKTGGAISARVNQPGTVTLENITMTQNIAGYFGGGLYLEGNLNFSMTSSSLTNNDAVRGGTIYSEAFGELIVSKDSSLYFSDASSEALTNGFESFRASPIVIGAEILCPKGAKMIPLTYNTNIRTYMSYSCEACPHGTYSLANGKQDANITCTDCPHGAVCYGAANVAALPHYWGVADASNTLEFYACPNGYCCSNIAHECKYDYCALHRTGILCGTCKEGTSAGFGAQGCVPNEKCNPQLVLGLVIACALLYTLVLVMVPHGKSGDFKVVLYFYQVVFAVTPKLRDVWQDYLVLVTTAASDVANLSIPGFFSGVCLFPNLKTHNKILMHYLLPIILVTALLYYFMALKGIMGVADRCHARKKKRGRTAPNEKTLLTQSVNSNGQVIEDEKVPDWTELVSSSETEPEDTAPVSVPARAKATTLTRDAKVNDRFGAAGITLVILSYSGFTLTSLNLLHCVDIQGQARLFNAAEEVKCYQWWQGFIIVFVGLVLAPLPILLLIFRKYARKYRILSSALGVIEDPYKPRVKWWEAVRLFRRFVIIVFFAFVIDPYLRTMCIALSCFIILMTHIYFAPFVSQFTQWSETGSLVILFLLSLLNVRSGVLQTAGADGTSGAMQQATTTGIDILVIACTLVPIVWALVALIRGIRSCVNGCGGIALCAL